MGGDTACAAAAGSIARPRASPSPAKRALSTAPQGTKALAATGGSRRGTSRTAAHGSEREVGSSPRLSGGSRRVRWREAFSDSAPAAAAWK